MSSLAVSEGRIATCYEYSLSLKIALHRSDKVNPNPPFDLVVAAKLHKQCKEDEEIRVSFKERNVNFHVFDNALQPFTCGKSKLNFDGRLIKFDVKFRPLLLDNLRRFIQFRLQLNHLLHYL